MTALSVGLLAVVGTNSVSSAGTAAASPPAVSASAAKQKATISALPAIAQPGSGTAKARKAKAAVAVELKPVRKNRPVVLQRKAGGGWKTAGRTKTTAAGLAEFTVPTKKARYRAVAAAYRGLSPVTTKTVSSAQWGKADWTDEFGGSRLASDWSHRALEYNPAGLRNCAKGDPSAATVTKGALRLSVLADPARAAETCTAYRGDGKKIGQFKYRLNGHVSTQGRYDFKYGVAAARMKFQKSKGQHTSFWLQPTTLRPAATTAARGGAEIDVIEWFGAGGKQSGLTSFIYMPSTKGPVKVGGFLKQQDRFLSSKKDDWWKRYHVFSVEWNKKAYIFRIDGKETARITKGISKVSQYPILSQLSSDYELPNLGSESRLPQHSYVDWIQVWEG
jgi:beta-glucanase (GH16 family)